MDIIFSNQIDIISKKDLFNAKNVIHPKKSLTEDTLFYPKEYFQIFGKNFVPDLSVIDLIFCEGPGARSIIYDSKPSSKPI
jgi:hypothetical protein